MENNTKTYLVGKNIKTLAGSEIPENSLDISKSTTQLYHIIPSCAYIISNSDGTAAPQEFSFFLFKKQNDTIDDVTKNTKFSIRYTVNDTEGTFNLSSNKLKESEFPYKLSDITSFIVQAMHDGIIAATFNIACVGEKSSGGGGSTGEKGEDGLMIYALPSIVTFQSNENGIVPEDQFSDSSKDIQIQAYRGSIPQTVIITNIKATNAETEIDDIKTDTFRFKSIAPQEIEMPQEDESATATKKVISYTSGQAVVQLSVDKVSCSITVPFIVDNTVLYNDFYTRTAKEMKSYYGLYTAQSDAIIKKSSEIQHSAEEITATARAIKQDSEKIQSDQSKFTMEANKQIQQVSSIVTNLQNDVTRNSSAIESIKPDEILTKVKSVEKQGKTITEQYGEIRTKYGSIETAVESLNKTVGEDGKEIINKATTSIMNDANSIVAKALKHNGEGNVRESIMNLTNDTFKLNILKNGLMAAGIDINYKDENGAGSKFTDSTINLIADKVSTNGDFSAASIQTKTYEKDNQTIDVKQPVIKIEKGLLTAYTEQQRLADGLQPNLRFGISDKSLQFEYRNNDGILLWTLGANGFVQYITSGQLQRKKIFYIFRPTCGKLLDNGEIGDCKPGDSNNFFYLPGTDQASINKKISETASKDNLKTCFQYVAPTVQGQIVEDTQFKLSTELAKKYNYRWFYSCSEDYTEKNLYEWDLSKNNEQLGDNGQCKCKILGSSGELIVEDNVKWTSSENPIKNGQHRISLVLDPDGNYGFAKEKPSGQDDYLYKNLPAIYYSQKIEDSPIIM